jgi:hypothetical protein
MQDKYISLNPQNSASEEKAIRKTLYRQRLREAGGGRAAKMLGNQWGLTAAVLTYSYLSNKGFAITPF